MATKPVSLPAWNTGGANNTEPSAGEKVSGWTVGQQPPSSYFNWWQKLTYEWTAYLDDLEAQAMNWTAEHVFDEKITVATTNATATAISGVGGSTSGIGVAGTAQVTSAGNGVVGLALGTGHGVAGAAVDASANGGNFVNNTNSATALKGTSTGTSSFGVWGEGKGAGVKGVGTALSAPGVVGVGGSTAPGGDFTGTGAAAGLTATGGATGKGGYFTGNTAAGVHATRSDSTTLPVILADGSIDLNGATYMTSTAGATNLLAANNLIKCWGILDIDSATGLSVITGFNLASASLANPSGVITVNIADDMASGTYAVFAWLFAGNPSVCGLVDLGARLAGSFELSLRLAESPYTTANYAALVTGGAGTNYGIMFAVLGEQ